MRYFAVINAVLFVIGCAAGMSSLWTNGVGAVLLWYEADAMDRDDRWGVLTCLGGLIALSIVSVVTL